MAKLKLYIFTSFFVFYLGWICPILGKSLENSKKNEVTNTKEQEVNFHRREVLSDVLTVVWHVDFIQERVTFNVTGKTRGYIGFGISSNGNMKGGDMIVGGVKDDGTPYFSDRFAVALETPVLDQKQDWHLIAASENESHTELSFYRPFHTCDDAQDVPITHDTLSIIWAVGESDELEYHSERGNSQVNFLDPPQPSVENLDYFSFKVPSHVSNSLETNYWCTVHRAPNFARKTHLTAFEVHLKSAEAVEFTHHVTLRKCVAPRGQGLSLKEIVEPWVGHSGDCYNRGLLQLKGLCNANIYLWTKGAKRLVFPEHVGFPVSEREEEEFYVIETHYDNPKLAQNISYENELRVFYTQKLREYDASLLYVGHEVDAALIIPPKVQDFKVVGHCPEQCTNSKLPQDGIKFFNVLLHAHLSSRKLKLRHFRDGEELPWIAYDNNYDFNFQQSRQLPQEVTIRRGDHLTLECTYDSTWKKPSGAVSGGLSSTQEMCDAWILYYPRILDLDVCTSSHAQYSKLLHKLGIERLSMEDKYFPDVVEPKFLEGRKFLEVLSNHVNWTEDLLQYFRNDSLHADRVSYCSNYEATHPAGEFDNDLDWPRTNYPKIRKEYQLPSPSCSS